MNWGMTLASIRTVDYKIFTPLTQTSQRVNVLDSLLQQNKISAPVISWSVDLSAMIRWCNLIYVIIYPTDLFVVKYENESLSWKQHKLTACHLSRYSCSRNRFFRSDKSNFKSASLSHITHRQAAFVRTNPRI